MEIAVADSGYRFPSRASHSERLRSYPPSRELGHGKQLLFDLRENAFHFFFSERPHGLGLDVAQ